MKIYTASTILKDNTIITVIVNIDKQIELTVTVLNKGFYKATKQYKKVIDKNSSTIGEEYIKHIIDNEVYDIANCSYKLTYNF